MHVSQHAGFANGSVNNALHAASSATKLQWDSGSVELYQSEKEGKHDSAWLYNSMLCLANLAPLACCAVSIFEAQDLVY